MASAMMPSLKASAVCCKYIQESKSKTKSWTYTTEDVVRIEERVSFLPKKKKKKKKKRKKKKFEIILIPIEDNVIATFQNGHYTDEIQE